MRRHRGEVKIGVISDTHGLMRPEALMELEGSEVILHAGDIGGPEILAMLGDVAPVHAVRGNCDGAWAVGIPWTHTFELGGATFHLLHDLDALDLDPKAAGISAVVCGHAHRPLVDWRDGVLFLNPGSAGPRRFDLPIAVARLTLDEKGLSPEIVQLG